MSRDLKSTLVIRHARMLLIKVGLKEEEADEFLMRLGKEAVENKLVDEDARLAFIETKLEEFIHNRPECSETLKPVVIGLVTGLAGNALWSAFESQIKGSPAPATAEPSQQHLSVIRINWYGAQVPTDLSTLGGYVRSADAFSLRR